jgi:Recombination endonuclease VII
MPFATKEQEREYNRKYYAEHRDGIIKHVKEYSKTHKAEKRAYDKKYLPVKRNRRRENPEAQREERLLRKYGLTLAAWNLLFDGQGRQCLICSTDSARWVTDHNHDTGKVRGILCNECNRGIGLLKDRSEILRRAAEHLDRQ